MVRSSGFRVAVALAALVCAGARGDLILPWVGSCSTSDDALRVVNYGSGRAISSYTNGTQGLRCESFGSSGSGVGGIASATSGSTFGVYGKATASPNGTGVYGVGALVGVKAESAAGWALQAVGNSTFSGNVAIGTSSTPSAQLTVASATAYHVQIQRPDFHTWGIGLAGAGSKGLGIYDVTVGSGYSLFLAEDGSVGVGTSAPAATLDVAGTTRTEVIQITGADVAEKFPVSAPVEPGMVVAIDPERAGELRLASEPYSRLVAGVVSGANGLKAGAVLGHLPGNEAAPPIALSGRVWCWCDAEAGGAIAPGDLLTSSATAGHAMRADEKHELPRGCVIGKAMSRLDSGRGLVLVLVQPQ